MTTQDIMERLSSIPETASVDKVFGKPETIGDKTIIPIAQISYGFGGGFGEGTQPEAQEGGQHGSGRGGGGGGGMSIVPKAVLEVTADQTKLIPVVDVTRVAMTGMMLAAWNVFWISRMLRRVLEKRR